MSIAATLITKKHIAISVVANSVGYSDLYTFPKMFKHHFGVSPSNYSIRE
ncbi:MAG: helix-turn-helix transcriptional regulator [Ruminococcaceae bacterium]|nr:helix-turn-helix transcriptional regulator [Oscillospiraceae bacterium]